MIFLSTFFPQKAVPPSLVLYNQSRVSSSSSSSSLNAIREPITGAEKVTATLASKLHHPKYRNIWIYRGKSPFFKTRTWCGLQISVDKLWVDNLTGNCHGQGHGEGATVDN